MPLDKEDVRGTEKDGSKSTEFCKYCYQEGKFTSPDMTLDDMKAVVISQMKKMNLGEDLIAITVRTLPTLNRWGASSRLSPSRIPTEV
jgi:hypothetical protein